MNIVVTLIIVVLIGIFSVYLRSLKKRYITIKITHWLLIIYLGILFLSLALSALLFSNMPQQEIVHEDQVTEIYRALEKGEVESANQKYFHKESFVVDNQAPMLLTSFNENGGLSIYVERKDINDGKVDSYIMNMGININGYYILDKKAPVRLELEDNQLKIYEPSLQNINISMAKKEFTIDQFMGKKVKTSTIASDIQAIYLRIPKDLKLEQQTLHHMIEVN